MHLDSCPRQEILQSSVKIPANYLALDAMSGTSVGARLAARSATPLRQHKFAELRIKRNVCVNA